MSKTADKTNVMRMLDQLQIPYRDYFYENDGNLSGEHVAQLLRQDGNRVFKTLVTEGGSRNHYVFVIPVLSSLNLKKAAKAAGEKYIEMIPQKQLLPLTGYIHGGCSPIGMKKFFTTFIDESAVLYDSILFSGGRIGCQVEMSLEDLRRVIEFTLADVCE